MGRPRKYFTDEDSRAAQARSGRAYYERHKHTVYSYEARRARDAAAGRAPCACREPGADRRLASVAPRLAIIRALPVHVPGSLVFPLLYGSGRQ